MGELTRLVSNGPDSFFASRAVHYRGRGNGPMWLIRSGRGVERKGRVSCYHFQLNSWKEKKWENSPVRWEMDLILYFASRAVDLKGCGDGPMWLIRSGRGVGRNGRVSCDNFQLNSWIEKKWENSQGLWAMDLILFCQHHCWSERMQRWGNVVDLKREGCGEEWQGKLRQFSIK